MRRPLLASVDEAIALNGLRSRTINSTRPKLPRTAAQQATGRWILTSPVIGLEPPGAPVPGGPWETACQLVRQYEFAQPPILRAVYRGH